MTLSKPETSSVTFQDQLGGGGNLEKSKSDSKLNQVSLFFIFKFVVKEFLYQYIKHEFY